MDVLAWAVLGLLAIAAATAIGPQLGIAAPLLLTIVGSFISLLPFGVTLEIEPEWILAGVLPPLLYSAAVSMPTMEFRRDFKAISGLSVVLVVISSIALGYMFAWLIPEIGLAGGIALGAIISPTDAVAISIVKRLGVSPRAVAVLEGESLLNDASALVMLRSAIAGMAVSVSFWSVFVQFLYAVGVAVAIGWIVGEINLRLRARVEDSTVNTVISFAIPFVAAIPAEHLGASGLVAAVFAGLVTGRSAPRFLSPRHRLSDSQNWRTVELVLEGGVFLIMGLELRAIIQGVQAEQQGIAAAIGIAALALLVTVLLRTLYVAPLLAGLQAESQRVAALKPTFVTMQNRYNDSTADEDIELYETRSRRPVSPKQVERWQTWLRRQLADIDYFLAEPLRWREGAIVVWAGMRGVVTLAAAQTLPEEMPGRSLLIFVAFLVAAGSLLLQGGTLPWLIRVLKPAGNDHHSLDSEYTQLLQRLRQAALQTLEKAGMSKKVEQIRERLTQGSDEFQTDLQAFKTLRLRIIEDQRNVLLDARDDGEFSATTLSTVLANLDADQISLELKGNPARE